ncbi:MAG TPA: GldG family protein [Kiritimatiellia bacterium]|nr:GldG family protein [Kiritimatiellia bacterium]
MDPSRHSMRLGRKRRWSYRLHGLASLLLAALLALMVNHLAQRHYLRTDISGQRFYELSQRTRDLLDGLTNRIDVLVFFQPGHESYRDIVNLLKEYEYASRGRIRVERIDPDRNISRTEALAAQFGIDEPNLIVLQQGEASRVITAADFVELDFAPMLRGGFPDRLAFRGEQALSSAILSLTQARAPRVYALTGHGERDFDNRDEHNGLSRVARAIARDHIDRRTLDLAETAAIPADADAVIIAGPSRLFSPSERQVLETYLNRSGRLLLLLDAAHDAGLTALLERWGIAIAPDIVIDPGRTLSGLDLFINRYARHPITEKLIGMNTVFYLPRSVEPLSRPPGRPLMADEPRVIPLAMTTTNGWAEIEPELSPPRFDPLRDRSGPISIAVAAERGGPAALGVEIRPSRLVVIGDSDFITNGGLGGANLDFFLNSLNWLLDRETLLSIAPRPFSASALTLNRAQLRTLFGIVVLGIPGAVALAGFLMAWLRRR